MPQPSGSLAWHDFGLSSDERTIISVQALWWAQILKVILGLGLTMVLRRV